MPEVIEEVKDSL